MKKILRNVLGGLLICSIVSGCQTFKWDAHPYVFVISEQIFVDANGDIIQSHDARSENMICFPSENIAELEAEIERINNKELRESILKEIENKLPKELLDNQSI